MEDRLVGWIHESSEEVAISFHENDASDGDYYCDAGNSVLNIVRAGHGAMVFTISDDGEISPDILTAARGWRPVAGVYLREDGTRYIAVRGTYQGAPVEPTARFYDAVGFPMPRYWGAECDFPEIITRRLGYRA